jgi:hypothetical protein
MSTLAEPMTLTFEAFWSWLLQHPNCLLRAGTPETVVYDDDDLHWLFASEGRFLVVQVLRGKRLMGEILVDPEPVSYVEGQTGDQEGEFIFELISESEKDRMATYFFVMAHGFEDEEEGHSPARVH